MGIFRPKPVDYFQESMNSVNCPFAFFGNLLNFYRILFAYAGHFVQLIGARWPSGRVVVSFKTNSSSYE